MKLLNAIEIFEASDCQIEVRMSADTVWLSQKQMADLFESRMLVN